MIFVDTAAFGEIRAALENPGVCGVTTNPRLIAQAAGEEALTAAAYRAFCETLCRHTGEDPRIRHLMIQTIGEDRQNCDLAAACRDQLAVSGSSSRSAALWIKIPPTLPALRGIDALRRQECKTLVTAVFTPSQALLAMESGADGIAVYFGRLQRHCADWERRLSNIVEIVREKNGLLLLASLSEPTLVAQALAYSHDITVPPTLVKTLMDSPLSQAAMEEFARLVRVDRPEPGFTVSN